jgi:ABC-type cobalamin/Fe3+-siderophores transport system ATPase subunit
MLKSLEITNFRLLEHFQVRKLGRVNLIVGKNNSGKSSVLEALRIYAGNAHRRVLQQIAISHNERALAAEPTEVEPDGALPFEALFSGRQVSLTRENTITIGQVAPDPDALTITSGYLAEMKTESSGLTKVSTRFIAHPDAAHPDESLTPCLRVAKPDRVLSLIALNDLMSPFASYRRANGMPCSFIPTQFVSIDELADEWDRIALTDDQEVIKEALRIITPEFEGLTFVRDVGSQGLQRTARVKLSTTDRPVPLNSLGDGVVRILQLVLKLFPAKGGFFLIDEFENGLHFSVQEKIWELLLTMAEKLDIQVFATTHSWDCIESFARAAHANQAAEGVLFRVGQSVRTSDHGRIIATVFDEEQLYSITQTDVEVR